MGGADGANGGREGLGWSLAAASSQAARAEGSTGHADGGGLSGGGSMALEEVLPMVSCE